jgi:uncharacterized phiE125 gp8 family phage protein
MALKRIGARAAAPVSLVEAKAHCRIDYNDDDVLLTLYIQAAVDYIEGNRGILGRGLVNQSWELTYDAFPCGAMKIPLGPLVSVTSVEYADPDTGVMTTWPASGNYVVDIASWEGWISPVEGWPSVKDTVNAVKVTFVAGHGSDPSSVPADIKLAMLMLIAHWYENRETVGDAGLMSVPMAFESLISAVRKITV